MDDGALLFTGATGLIGGATLERILRREPGRRIYVLVRDPTLCAEPLRRWEAVRRSGAIRGLAARAGRDARCHGGRGRDGLRDGSVIPVRGDLTLPGLGLDREDLARLRREVGVVVHAAADTRFSNSLECARQVNTAGTAQVLDLASRMPGLYRLVHVSTAFVAGRATGRIVEGAVSGAAGWVNAYERSKWEAETLVRRSALPWVIARPSTVVCDSGNGHVSQVNAVHRALRLYRQGLVPMLPGTEDTHVDLVTTAWVAEGVARLALGGLQTGATANLCAGAGALSLEELLDRSRSLWAKDPEWRRRGVARPALVDLETYRFFEETVRLTADARLRAITRGLSHFAPQLALPKRFETAVADVLMGGPAPRVADYWERLVAALAPRRGPTGLRAA